MRFEASRKEAGRNVLRGIREQGGLVQIDDATIRVRPAKARVPPALLSALERHKAEVYRLLGGRPAAAPTCRVVVLGGRQMEVLNPSPSPEESSDVASGQGGRQADQKTGRPPPSPESRYSLRGFWVKTRGSGRRFVLPRLSQVQFRLLTELDLCWQAYLSLASDPRTRRSLERRGLAAFREHAYDVVEATLTPAGEVVRDAFHRKQVRKTKREYREERRREKSTVG